jgi:hypothetical protein
MHNVTLVCTIHSEIGKCNSDELYKIIDYINPDVIFEELPCKSFDKIYNSNRSDIPLEAKCIKKYLQNHDIEHIPVDSIADPNRPPLEKLMFEKFQRDTEYKKFKYDHNVLTAREGFDYLNSDRCMDLVEKWILIEKRIVESDKHKDLYLHRHNSFYEDVDNRENVMLQNIYNYSKENQYYQALFLLGCGHRKSVISKITEYEKLSEIKLNWTIYNNTQTELVLI